MDTGKVVALVGLGGVGIYFLFVRRNPQTGLALVDEILAPRQFTDQATSMPGGVSGSGPANAAAPGTSAIGLIGASSAAVAGFFGLGGSTAAAGAAATTAATSGASAGAAGVAGGVGLAGTLAITGGIAGAALLTWAVWKKGLFRGGEEALLVNPDRDQFLAQPAIAGRPDGTDGSAWTKTNAWKLAAQLTEWGYGDGGGPTWQRLMSAEYVDPFKEATSAIQKIYAAHGIRIQAP